MNFEIFSRVTEHGDGIDSVGRPKDVSLAVHHILPRM